MTKPSLDPARWTPPEAGAPSTPQESKGIRSYETSGHGTEDVLVREDGHILTGVEDGRILAIDPATGTESVVADVGGRLLGMEHHPDGGYVVCGEKRGILRVSAGGEVTELVSSFEGAPFLFCNNAAVAQDGTIYFTESSTKFDFEWYRGDLIEHRPTGRLFRRDVDGTVTVLRDGLAFANGVALAPDESFLVFAETGRYALTKLWLTGDRAGSFEPFGAVLPGFPDNISTGEDGNFWVALVSPRDKTLDALLPRAPWLRKVVWSLPERLQPQPKSVIHVQAYASDGTLVHDIAGVHQAFGKPSGVRQAGNQVWMGSFEMSTIGVLDLR